jgi:hypothetical protein
MMYGWVEIASHILVYFYLNCCYDSVPIHTESIVTALHYILRLQVEETSSGYVFWLFYDAVDIGANSIEW